MFGEAAGGPMPIHDDVLEDVNKWQQEGRRVVLATVVATWGSAPRPVGSQLCVDETGSFSGSVSGGCIEAAVVREALRVLDTGSPRLVEFQVTNDMAWEVGLSCGGRVEIFVAAAEPQQRLLSTIMEARARGEGTVLATALPGGEQALLVNDAFSGDLELDDQTQAIARRIAMQGESLAVLTDAGRIFLHAFPTPPRLIVVGAVHITEPLSRMATSAGYEVLIVDPRRSFAHRRQFAGLQLVGEWPDVALQKLKLDRGSAVVTLTHDPKLDDAALRVALASEAFYIGCLGSRKTHLARLSRLRAAGFGDPDLARLHGPIGLAIGARTPAEIAVSILAEITQVRRGEEPL